MPTRILGISAYYHDSAAALVQDGAIVAAAQEERFTRKKHDPSFPRNAAAYCLEAGQITLREVDQVVYFEKPLVKFERLLETYLSCSPRGFRSFLTAMPVWLTEKLYLKKLLKDEMTLLGKCGKTDLPPLLFSQHHQAHAAAAFFPSPFQRAAVLCMDGVGEWATTSVWLGEGNTLVPQWQLDFPHSLGLLYSAFTQYAGFKVNSGEYKLMGLAPYGEPRYVKAIRDSLIDLKEDGTFRLNMRFFDFAAGLTMTNRQFHALFGGPPRLPETPITQRHMDIARSIQEVTESIVLRLARSVHSDLGTDALCLSGGVALNCVVNGRLRREGPFRDIWIQPAAGDAGGAIGAALAAWHEHLGMPRKVNNDDAMAGAYLGPSFTRTQIRTYLDSVHARYRDMTEEALVGTVAELLDEGKVIGWFQGRMEFGPRALGNRSILGDARRAGMQSQLNQKIKYRESFRPFAPAVLEEAAADFFIPDSASPYMLFVADMKPGVRLPLTKQQEKLTGFDKLSMPRSTIPAVTHVDGTARVQTVSELTNPRFHRLLRSFKDLTGSGVLINTSFNVRGEPIVCTPEDAYRCFMRTDMDYLVLEDLLLGKREQEQGCVVPQGSLMMSGLPEPGPAVMRSFALGAAGLLAGVFGIMLPWRSGREWPLWPWIIAAVFALVGLLRPASLRPVYRGWMSLVLILAKINSALVLGAFFLFFLSPTGIILRLIGYPDPLQRRFSADEQSYRKPSITPSRNHMERPY